MKRPRRETFPITDIVQVVGDGAIAGPVVEGALVPVLILDTSQRPDIEEAIRVQQYLPPGDVGVQWGGIADSPDIVSLIVNFLRPVQTRVIIFFNIEAQAILVESILAAKALYLQAGKAGDRIVHDPGHRKMLIEVPDTGFRPQWEKMLLRSLSQMIAREGQVSRRKAVPYAQELIEELRKITCIRFK